jgi:glutamate synthase (ferredoxin)
MDEWMDLPVGIRQLQFRSFSQFVLCQVNQNSGRSFYEKNAEANHFELLFFSPERNTVTGSFSDHHRLSSASSYFCIRTFSIMNMRGLAVLVSVVPALAFVPRSHFIQKRHPIRTTDRSISSSPSPPPIQDTARRWWSDDAVCHVSTTRLSMAFDPSKQSNMFEGPMALVQERDACGVGFIANTQSGEEFGTHRVVQQGLSALTCMEHRGACGGDRVSGDGAGVMTQIPWKLFKEFRSESCPQPGVGMVFLPRDPERRKAAMEIIEQVCTDNELSFLGWREVPVDPSVLGENAKKAQPHIMQFFVKAPARLQDTEERDGFERTLYLVRRRFGVERRQRGLVWDDDEVYFASFSSRTIVYKGMVQSEVLPLFYKDLTNPDFTSKFIIYHRRFSTNTNPRWPLAQPMRVVGHNGEINTLLGNVNWVKAREAQKDCEKLPEDLVDYQTTENIVTMCNTQDIPSILEPVVDLSRSDSANLDGVFELMCKSRHRAPCALMAMVPTAYENNPDLKNNPEIVDFYKFHGGLLEAWDGPALLVFSDGKSIGASLDRNGLRPARYSIAKDGTVYMMSETGVVPDLLESEIVQKGRLGPGQMVNVDLETGEFKDNIRIKSEIAKRKCEENDRIYTFFSLGKVVLIFLSS